jgi:RNA polymerase sigma-70 factor (ECF subfamily)
MQTLETRRPTHFAKPLARLSAFSGPGRIELKRPAANDEAVFTVPLGESEITVSPGVFKVPAGALSAGRRETIFRELVKDYGSSLYYYVLKRVGHADDAADIAQQAFVEAACSLSAYRGEAELSTWIFGIATNLTRNHINRAPQYRHRFESDEILETCESGDVSPEENLSQREGLALVTEAMSLLPPEMAEALSLIAVEEMSYQDAAIELNVPVGTVRSRVSRARAAVRKHLRESGYATAEA